MRTFAVSDVPRAERPLRPVSLAASLWLQHKLTAEACGSNLGHLVYGLHAIEHALLQTVHAAFEHHYPLVLSPDDIWLCIAQSFGVHVNLHAEELRGRFVRHEGKETLTIERGAFVKGSPDNDWPGCFAEFSDRIAEHVGKSRDLVVASFSTTGPVERAASEIVLMSAMLRYFKYEMITMCGIPEITLLGTPEDWRAIRRRSEVLAEYGLTTWMQGLLPVLDELVATASGGAVNRDFWASFYKYRSMSGGSRVTGWINVLFPYLEHQGTPRWNPGAASWGVKLPESRMDAFPKGLSLAPFTWTVLGERFSMELLGGFVGVSQDPQTWALRPAIGWAVRDTTSSAQPPEEAKQVIEAIKAEWQARDRQGRKDDW
ncbi:DUF4419 domain-containing protein [Sorangium sp. So ce321]|uniref:DUF4419 domain-containing protein n=1 Tax=Sorangium sp. So ce321 TaxID=3133300 RepID=UPI003F60D497